MSGGYKKLWSVLLAIFKEIIISIFFALKYFIFVNLWLLVHAIDVISQIPLNFYLRRTSATCQKKDT